MHYFFCLIYLCLGLISIPTQAIDFSGFPPCDAPACESVAVAGEWPTVDAGQMRQISFHGFTVSISPNGKLVRDNVSFRQFAFSKKRTLSLSIFKREDMDEFFKASRYDMSDWADIVFTQTPKSKVPKNEADAYAWYSALMTKVVFVGGHAVKKYTKPPTTLYLINGKFSQTNTLMVVSGKHPNVLLKIEAGGFDQPAVMRLIAGISSIL